MLLDTSSSMSGRPIDMLNRGFELFCDEIKKDDLARKRAEIAVITFGGVARVEIPFTEGRDLQPRRLNASGSTPMGAALDLALDQLAAQKQAYKQAGLEYYRPWLFVLTDGAPTDGQVFTAAAARVRKLRPRPSAIGIRLLPDPIADMFRRAFEDGAANPADRPSALEWQQALSGLDAHLRECGKNQAHIYPDHLGACPWCHHASAAGPVLQQPLPPAKAPARTTSLVAAPQQTGPPRTVGVGGSSPIVTPPIRSGSSGPAGPWGPPRVRRRTGRNAAFLISSLCVLGVVLAFVVPHLGSSGSQPGLPQSSAPAQGPGQTTASGSVGQPHTNLALAGSWMAVSAPLPRGAAARTSQNATLQAIACPTAASCVATGTTSTARGHPRVCSRRSLADAGARPKHRFPRRPWENGP